MQTLILIIQLLPSLITIIKTIEEAIPGQGAGEAKLAAVRGVLEVGNDKINDYWPQIVKVIGVLVAMFNKTGWSKPVTMPLVTDIN